MFMFKGDRVIILRESERDKRMNKRDVLSFPFEIQRGRETFFPSPQDLMLKEVEKDKGREDKGSERKPSSWAPL